MGLNRKRAVVQPAKLGTAYTDPRRRRYAFGLGEELPVRTYANSVEDPAKYGNLFKKGDRVLEVHAQPAKPQAIVHGLHGLFSNLNEIRNAGYVGFYSLTPVKSIRRIAKKLADKHGCKVKEVVPAPISEFRQALLQDSLGVKDPVAMIVIKI